MVWREASVTPESLWNRYASIWSSEPAVRTIELQACLADRCSYCDANGLIEGRDALSAYMGGFQQNVKGARFEILSVTHHHDRMLAEWRLLGPGGAVLQTGRSFAMVGSDGRLRNITGFFDPAEQSSAG
jgi:SnoaL-like domain